MNVDSIRKHNLEVYKMQRANVEYRREEDYRKLLDKRSLDKIVADRIQRNIRLGLGKGRNIDVEV